MQFHRKLRQELSQCINELLWHENYLFLSKSKQEKLTMLTQLPFHKDKDFQQFQLLQANAHCVNSIYCWVCTV